MKKMFRSSALIEEIKQKPSLWDPAYKQSAGKKIRAKQWVEVAQNLFPNWSSMRARERNEKVQEVKRKWKNIRDYYKRGSKNWNGKKYVYSHLLHFLEEDSAAQKSISSRKSDENSIPPTSIQKTEIFEFENDEITQNESICESEDHEAVQEFIIAESDVPSAIEVTPASEQLTTAQSCFQINSEPDGDNDHECTNDQEPPLKRRSQQNSECDDADRCFLLSLLPEMRNMTGLQKVGFKINVLNELSSIMRDQQSLTIKEELFS
ncbi:uncharacterized protein LOC129943144 [Eupeodes corollae]|uniref:uncharacterized protein LOC129943144 n=1 Tax=Eupeodes corollae TaxID=290404 RepID=UPI0024902BF7|nr:uncharacterized protein LOC129943144 [Eupeodes corollae]